jgi:hypothetical protein
MEYVPVVEPAGTVMEAGAGGPWTYPISGKPYKVLVLDPEGKI